MFLSRLQPVRVKFKISNKIGTYNMYIYLITVSSQNIEFDETNIPFSINDEIFLSYLRNRQYRRRLSSTSGNYSTSRECIVHICSVTQICNYIRQTRPTWDGTTERRREFATINKAIRVAALILAPSNAPQSVISDRRLILKPIYSRGAARQILSPLASTEDVIIRGSFISMC